MEAQAPVVLLFLLVTTTIELFAFISAQQNTTTKISPGSSLSPSSNNSYWLSHSGHFAFGFYEQGHSGSLAVGVWFEKSTPKTVVWTANRDAPPLPRDTTRLILTLDGKLILRDTRGGSDVPIYSSSPAAASASVLDSGNLVLYATDSSVVWQSFDSPTDTLLSGQRLDAGKQLVSAVNSETNHSSGRFQLEMQTDGNLVQYPVLTTERKIYHAYYASNTVIRDENITLNLNSDGQLYLLNGKGVNIRNLSVDTDRRQLGDVVTYRLTLDSDGVSRLYSHTLSKSSSNTATADWVVKWESVRDKCAPIGLCGFNSYCVEPPVQDQAADCACAPGFDFLDPGQKNLGCAKNLSGCDAVGRNVSMQELDGITWEDDPYWISSTTDKAACKENCLQDCNCEAAFFQDQKCRRQMLPLKFARVGLGATATAMFKVVSPKEIKAAVAEGKPVKVERKQFLTVGISFTVFGLIALSLALFLVCRISHSRSRRRFTPSELPKLMVDEEVLTLRPFTFDELVLVTNGFAERLGRGAFGTVFKGSLQSGSAQRAVAVKRLEKVVDEGEVEFRNEMRSIGRIHHRNLLRLLGYCQEGPNRLLVYEYMSNGSLSDFLFKSSTKPDWDERVKIALGVARGILYLHEECESQIIHCDINPNNILIDENHSAKIADFGLAKLLLPDQTRTNTGIRGTRGFVAPEWHRNMPITAKADVYSFGVVLLVIICCRRGVDINVADEEIILVDWVIRCFERNEVGNLVRGEQVDEQEFDKFARIGLWCIQEEPAIRPAMKKVVAMFEGTMDIPIPPKPTSYKSTPDSDQFSVIVDSGYAV